ncbi:MAG: hypothetical protein ACREV6_12800 [Clostridium sp.]|uniref:hypothetical protein n=1 Tax=Clostridium sp. TaxID=1506 RepID=UPI003D6D85F4
MSKIINYQPQGAADYWTKTSVNKSERNKYVYLPSTNYSPIFSITGKGRLKTIITKGVTIDYKTFVRVTVDGVVKCNINNNKEINKVFGLITEDLISCNPSTGFLSTPYNSMTEKLTDWGVSYPTEPFSFGVCVIAEPIIFESSLLIEIMCEYPGGPTTCPYDISYCVL